MAERLSQCQTGDLSRLAAERIPATLALEIKATRQSATARRDTGTDPKNGPRESALGRRARCGGTASQTGCPGIGSDRPAVSASGHWTAAAGSFAALDDLRAESCPG